MIMHKYSLGRLSFSLFAVTILLTSCSVNPLGNESQTDNAQIEDIQILDFQGMINEYQETAKNLDLPSGYIYPDNLFGDQNDELYQQGYGRNQAVFVWNCAWGKEWLAMRGVNEDRAAEAFEIYSSVRDTSTYRESWDPVSIQKPFEDALEAAQLGDPSQIQEDIISNCPA